MPKAAVLALVVGIGAWTTSFSVAGFQDPRQTPVFKTGTDLVHFDVSVLDKDRHPVRGLTAADFTILEDGKSQPISAFAAVDVPQAAPAPSAKWMREVSIDVRANDAEQNPEGRLFVLIIDDGLLPPNAKFIQNAKRIGRGVVERLSPTDQLAVVFTLASKNSQDYTTDRRKLLAAIDSLTAGPAQHTLGWDNVIPIDPRRPELGSDPVMDSDSALRMGSLRTLQLAAEALIAAPRRRKALIFVSPGVTVDTASAATPLLAGPTVMTMAMYDDNRRLTRDLPEVFRRMQRANVTAYPIDPCGPGGLEDYVATKAQSLITLSYATQPVKPDYNWFSPGGIPPRPVDLAHHKATLDMDFLMATAANTGGRAIVSTNDFDSGLDSIFQENGSYYLVGYTKSVQEPPGFLHRVAVKVNRQDVTVRTRSGYEVEKPRPVPSKDPVTVALAEAGAGPLAASALPLSVALAPVAYRGRPRDETTAVTIVLGLRESPVKVRTPQIIDLQTSIYTPDGVAVGKPQRRQATFTLPVGTGADLQYELLTHVAVKPGRYLFRIAARRATDGAIGSVYADVEVPDFSKAPLSASGVWLEALPGLSAVTPDGLVPVIPVVPTAVRNFSRGDQVSAFFRIYQGGNAPLMSVDVTVRIVNDKDTTIATAEGTIPAERFDLIQRAADHSFAIPISELGPGRYLLSFDLSLREAVFRRDVVVTVR